MSYKIISEYTALTLKKLQLDRMFPQAFQRICNGIKDEGMKFYNSNGKTVQRTARTNIEANFAVVNSTNNTLKSKIHNT